MDAVVETDCFCDCGYNLHGQRTHVDDRLGFAVTRCPECGKFHPAGHASTARRVWLQRLAALMLTVWMLLLIGAGLATAGATLGTSFAYLETFTRWVEADPRNGRPIVEEQVGGVAGPSWRYTYADTGEAVPPPDPTAVRPGRRGVRVEAEGRRFYPALEVPARSLPAGYDFGWRGPPPTWRSTLGFAASVFVGGSVLGVLQSVLLWHNRWPRKLLPPVLVALLAGGAFVAIVTSNADRLGDVRWLVAEVLVVVPGVLLAGWAIALSYGRPLARVVAGALIPPGPRQALGHLWFADGKPAPKVSG